MADAILDLATQSFGQREIRFLTVRKLRGGAYQSGQHSYRLSSSGVHLFPRLADTRIEAPYALGEVRMSSGIPALDGLLADGYWPGASTLLKYVQDDHSILRAVSVIKSRASYHHPDIRPFLIGGDGIVLTGSLGPPDGR